MHFASTELSFRDNKARVAILSSVFPDEFSFPLCFVESPK
jgi:hypothetical protein